MSQNEDLVILQRIVQAQYQQQLQSFQKIIADETRLRDALQKLDDQMRATRAQDSQTSGMRAIGADVLWQGWVDRARTELNMQLARTLAIKEHHRARVAKRFGKVQVTEELLKQDVAARSQRRRKNALDQAIETAVFNRSQ